MALIVSSFGKILMIFKMIWTYERQFSSFTMISDVFIFTSNVMAVYVFLETSALHQVVRDFNFGNHFLEII